MAGKLNIYLIGLSGTGKTRSGQLVAEVLGWPFVEMDGVIEDRCGKTIPDIFKDNGEEYFRDLESFITKCVNNTVGVILNFLRSVSVKEILDDANTGKVFRSFNWRVVIRDRVKG